MILLSQKANLEVPKEIRERKDINVKDEMEFFINGNEIYLKKIENTCCICGNSKELIEHNGKLICKECINELSQIG